MSMRAREALACNTVNAETWIAATSAAMTSRRAVITGLVPVIHRSTSGMPTRAQSARQFHREC